jgi:eukaryotic-like serine/threonine-protein kinase
MQVARRRSGFGTFAIPIMLTSPPPATGTVIAGRYALGAAASPDSGVFSATDTRLQREVFLRLLPPGAVDADGDRAAAAALEHPNTARVLDSGHDPALDADFVVTERLAGGTLGALLAQRGAPPPQLAARMLREAIAGTAAGHAAGLVHGLLHPGALFLSRDEERRLRVVVLGFGAQGAAAALTSASARYASPERLRRGGMVTPASDVFSLGVIAYELLAGLPDDWKGILTAMARRQAVEVPPPSAGRTAISAAVSEAIVRALAAEPADRWPDAAAFLAALPLDASRAEPAAAAVKAPPPPQPRHDVVVVPSGIVGDAPREPAAPPPSAPALRPAAPARTAATVLAAADLRDHIYIPPDPAKRPPAADAATTIPAAPAPAPAPPPAQRERASALPDDAAQRQIPDVPAEASAPALSTPRSQLSVPTAVAGPAVAPSTPPPAPAVRASVDAAPEPVREPERPAPRPAPVARATVATVPAARTPLGRFGGGARPGPGATSPRRVALAAAAAAVGLLTLGAVGYAVTRAPAAPPVLAAAGLAGGATAEEGAVEPPQPSTELPELAAEAAETPPEIAATSPVETAAEQRAREDERRRQEEQRRAEARRLEEERQRAREASQIAQTPPVQPQAPQPPAAPAPASPPPPAPSVAAPTTAVAARDAPSRPVTATDVNRIYPAGEVDEPPSLTNRGDVQRASARAYPRTLSGSGIGGRMVVTFVVLENGRVDPASVSIVQSPHAALSAAAGQVLAAARFRPARAGGRAVRTAVSMPIDWSDGR